MKHQNHFPYHVTTRITEEKFSSSLVQVWHRCQKALKLAHHQLSVEVISFVLMDNHYHLLMKTPKGNIEQFMAEFHRHLENEHFSSAKWCLIASTEYFSNCYRYVYQNPLRAGLVRVAEDYPFSTLRHIVKGEKFSVPVHDKYGFKDEYALQ